VELLSAQETERKRIAHELHDSICQVIASIKLRAERALSLSSKSAAVSRQALRDMVPLLQSAVDEVRRISTDLRPAILDELGIVATLSWWAREFRAANPRIELDVAIQVREQDVPAAVQTAIYRVLQEATHNAVRHAGAKHLKVGLQWAAAGLELLVADDGCGFDPPAQRDGNDGPDGLGLVSMRERVEALAGTFTVDSAPGHGTGVRALWRRSVLDPSG
jgi:signal transduction histidine kinase